MEPVSENTVDPLSYLDNPVWHSLATRHAALAIRNGSAACYRPEISAIGGLAETTPAALEDLSKLARPGRYLLVLGLEEIGVEEMGAYGDDGRHG